MGELFGEIGSGFRVSMKDSIVMDILHSAMNKAHEKLKSKEGLLERLIETSKFYELAVMELEGCLRIVQVETDNFPLDTKHEQLLSELFIMKNRLQGRLEETELSILNKDRELLEKEFILKQALELKERELISFQEGREEEICELKNSIERKVSNFKQKFLDDYEMGDEEMSFDIDNLKETLDLAFEKMQAAICSCEAEPSEQSWRWEIENNTISIVTRGFVHDSRKLFRKNKHEMTVNFPAKHWSDLMTEVTSLRNELENQTEAIKVKKIDQMETHLGGVDKKDDESRYVAKMIKNHESIIRQKSEEMKWLLLKGELSQDKGCSSLRKDSDLNGLRVKIQQVIANLDNLINWNAKTFGDDKFSYVRNFMQPGKLASDDYHEIDENVPNHVQKLIEELEESNLLTKLLEDTYLLLSKGMMENLYINLVMDNFFCEGLHRFVYGETIKSTINTANSALRQYQVELDQENAFKEDIYNFIITEVMKDADLLVLKKSQDLLYEDKIAEANEEELILKLDSLLKFHQHEEESYYWVIFDDISLDEKCCFSSISDKLEMSLQQLNASKALLSEFGSTSRDEISDQEKVHDQVTPLGENGFFNEESLERESILQNENKEGKLSETGFFMESIIMGFSNLLATFQREVIEKIRAEMLRLQDLKNEHEEVLELVAAVTRRKTVYKKAFINNCLNLQKAETEVDLLGDQVDVLLDLLEKIYATLDRYSPILQHYFGVSDVMRLIKKELSGPAAQLTI